MELNVKAKPQSKPQAEGDPYAMLKISYAEGKVLQWFDEEHWRWIDITGVPKFLAPVTQYRVKPVPPVVDQYAELKKAHANGKNIQFLNSAGVWVYVKNPSWMKPVPCYRIQPEVEVKQVSLALYKNHAGTTWWVGHKNEQGTWEKLINLTITDGVPTSIAFKE